MSRALLLTLALLSSSSLAAHAADQQHPEQVQSDISTREISIQSNFTGIDIVLFGAVDYSRAPISDEGPYDVIMVVKGPNEPMVVRRKERVAGLWMNGPSERFASVPGYYAVLSTRPFRAIASEGLLQSLGIGLANVDFGRSDTGAKPGNEFRAALIRIRQEHELFVEKDDGVSFLGRSLFRGSVELPVNVPIGRYTTQVFLIRDGKVLSESQSSLKVHKVGLERMIYVLAFRHPFLYGLLAVAIAVLAGLLAWLFFKRN